MAMTLGAWRRAKKITQGEMAEKLNVHINTYQNWEKAPEKISIAHAIMICNILGLSLNDVEFRAEA